MNCVAGRGPSDSEVCRITLLFASCCLSNDISPLHKVSHQQKSKYILDLLYMNTIILSFVALQRLDASGCIICCISKLPWLCHSKVASADSDTEGNAHLTHCIHAAPSSSFSSSSPALLDHRISQAPSSLLTFAISLCPQIGPSLSSSQIEQKSRTSENQTCAFMACLERSQDHCPVFGTSSLRERQKSCHGIHLM